MDVSSVAVQGLANMTIQMPTATNSVVRLNVTSFLNLLKDSHWITIWQKRCFCRGGF